MNILKKVYRIISVTIPTWYYCLRSGLNYNKTWHIRGRMYINRSSWLIRAIHSNISKGTIDIGDNFSCNNSLTSNSIGVFQPCFFNISCSGSRIIIGNHVGISGTTLNATRSITIGDNVLIGSGCLITDTDSHPLYWDDRVNNKNELTASAPIVIENDAFIGGRSIILKGVTIGKGAVVGAGSVVSKDVPPYCVVCGNPARIVKSLKK